MTMVSTISYRFNVNGQLTDILEAKMGLRQGDPISPLLFVIVMECLNRGDKVSVEKMMNTYGMFSKATGLVVNPQKCRMYCASMDDLNKQNILRASGFQEGQLPFKYLGVPVTGKKLSVCHFAPLIDKIVGKIKHWTARLLTYAGRLQLINSIMFAMTHYWLTCFPFPKTVLHRIDSICRIFLWTGGFVGSRKAPVARQQICSPRSHGGLNVVDLEAWNKATIMKLL
ncbi:unnamed protein product [Lathyrus sativus]|nr:unnamed protein product [Lathyrus sativus]